MIVGKGRRKIKFRYSAVIGVLAALLVNYCRENKELDNDTDYRSSSAAHLDTSGLRPEKVTTTMNIEKIQEPMSPEDEKIASEHRNIKQEAMKKLAGLLGEKYMVSTVVGSSEGGIAREVYDEEIIVNTNEGETLGRFFPDENGDLVFRIDENVARLYYEIGGGLALVSCSEDGDILDVVAEAELLIDVAKTNEPTEREGLLEELNSLNYFKTSEQDMEEQEDFLEAEEERGIIDSGSWR